MFLVLNSWRDSAIDQVGALSRRFDISSAVFFPVVQYGVLEEMNLPDNSRDRAEANTPRGNVPMAASFIGVHMAFISL